MPVELRAVPIGNENPDPFADFWILYPRKIAKKDALKAWSQIDPNVHAAIIIAIALWRNVWREKDPEFLPYPATWLNGERWEDEVPEAYRQRRADADRAEPIAARQPIPDHVRLLLAKLRATPR